MRATHITNSHQTACQRPAPISNIHAHLPYARQVGVPRTDYYGHLVNMDPMLNTYRPFVHQYGTARIRYQHLQDLRPVYAVEPPQAHRPASFPQYKEMRFAHPSLPPPAHRASQAAAFQQLPGMFVRHHDHVAITHQITASEVAAYQKVAETQNSQTPFPSFTHHRVESNVYVHSSQLAEHDYHFEPDVQRLPQNFQQPSPNMHNVSFYQSQMDQPATAQSSYPLYIERTVKQQANCLSNKYLPRASQANRRPGTTTAVASTIVNRKQRPNFREGLVDYPLLADTSATTQVLYHQKSETFSAAQIFNQPQPNTMTTTNTAYQSQQSQANLMMGGNTTTTTTIQAQVEEVKNAEVFYQPSIDSLLINQTNYPPQMNEVTTTEVVYQPQADILTTRQISFQPQNNELRATQTIYQPVYQPRADVMSTQEMVIQYETTYQTRTTGFQSQTHKNNKQEFANQHCKYPLLQDRNIPKQVAPYEAQTEVRAPILRQMLSSQDKHNESPYENIPKALNKKEELSGTQKKTVQQTRKRKPSSILSDSSGRSHSLPVKKDSTIKVAHPTQKDMNGNSFGEMEWMSEINFLASSRSQNYKQHTRIHDLTAFATMDLDSQSLSIIHSRATSSTQGLADMEPILKKPDRLPKTHHRRKKPPTLPHTELATMKRTWQLQAMSSLTNWRKFKIWRANNQVII